MVPPVHLFFCSILAKYLNDYIFLTVGRVGGATTDITQSVVEVSEYEKREKLGEILKAQRKLYHNNYYYLIR